MAVCNIQDLFDAAKCFAAIPRSQIPAVQTALLCAILQARNPVATCDVQSLMSDSACFFNLPSFMLEAIQTQLMCEILQAGSSGQSCLVCADSDPVNPPACSCALAVNRLTSSFWYWDSNLNKWFPLIQ